MHKIFPHIRNSSAQQSSPQENTDQQGVPASDVPIKVRLSPLSRLYWTLNSELELDKALVADANRYERFVRMQQVAEQKRDHILRNVIILDALVFLLLFGKGFTIPAINMSLNDIPAAREALTFLASLTFQFLALAFVNWQGYAAIINSINVHRAKSTAVDPDFLSASDKFLEFVVKLYREKMNIHGVDFVIPGRSYKIMSASILLLLKMSILSFLILHLAAVFVSARETYLNMPGILKYVYFLFLLAANMGGVLVFFSMGRSFEFVVPPPQAVGSSEAQSGEQP